jgi:3-hydroxybutyryl-CoA dehydrogenase
MKIVVCAPDALLAELKDVKQHFSTCSKEEVRDLKTDVLIYLFEDGTELTFKGSTYALINSVVLPVKNSCDHKNILRINGWPGFVQRECWEVAGEIDPIIEETAKLLGKRLFKCADTPGFTSARILSMIINEAFFAKEENISSESEIDTAMKLGTGYPYGPFEWAEKIGLKKISDLLHVLSVNDSRYTPSKSLAYL